MKQETIYSGAAGFIGITPRQIQPLPIGIFCGTFQVCEDGDMQENYREAVGVEHDDVLRGKTHYSDATEREVNGILYYEHEQLSGQIITVVETNNGFEIYEDDTNTLLDRDKNGW